MGHSLHSEEGEEGVKEQEEAGRLPAGPGVAQPPGQATQHRLTRLVNALLTCLPFFLTLLAPLLTLPLTSLITRILSILLFTQMSPATALE